ncbi:polysaccharide biosynthesis tyrosine autokinase [Telluribacter sp. SYSU D00476]|uniref:GumC family protein n=1 Tax=Telluribacter sp. SYSU D00476 TaxID=2811430 RepID=UPI001FF6A6A3|nr:polysaccharide biosynthesis tyrosine autokinase [Telluribacter sp. SYSU D00476]
MADREATTTQVQPSGRIDIKKSLYRYLRHWYYFLIGLVLALGVGIFLMVFITPKYLIYSTILVRDIDKGPDFQAGNPAFQDLGIFNQATSIDNEIEAFRSLSLMERTLKELALYTSYYVQGIVKKEEIYGSDVPIRVVVRSLKKSAYDEDITITIRDTSRFELLDWHGQGTYRFGQPIVKPYGAFSIVRNPKSTGGFREVTVRFNNIRKLAVDYNEDLKITQTSKNADVLNLSFLNPLPEKGKDIMSTLIQVYNQDEREDQNRLALSTVQFIDDRLRELTAELTENELQEARFKIQNRVTDVRSEASAYLEESRTYNQQLSTLNTQIQVVESLERYLSRPGELYELVPSNLNIEDRALMELIGRFNDLQLDRERMLRTQEPTSPLVQNINTQLATLRQSIAENLKIIRRGLEVTRNNIASRARGFQSRISEIPNIERELNDINRQQGVRRDLYVYLLQKREESALYLASTGSKIRVLDPPGATLKPETPKKPIVLALALFAGLVIPFGLVMAKGLLSDRVKHRETVERLTTTPILGEITHHRGRKPLILYKKPRAMVAEEFRFIRSKLTAMANNEGKQVILITSGMNRDGKTFVGVNLGTSLSMAGYRVVMLDFNLRQSDDLLSYLGIQSDTGITEFINTKTLTAENLIKASPVSPGFYFHMIGSGSAAEQPTELMMNPRIGQLITQLKENFDYILIDTPAIGQVADAYSLARYVDVCLYVVRYNHTKREYIATVDEINKEGRFNSTMIVLNDARREN